MPPRQPARWRAGTVRCGAGPWKCAWGRARCSCACWGRDSPGDGVRPRLCRSRPQRGHDRIAQRADGGGAAQPAGRPAPPGRDQPARVRGQEERTAFTHVSGPRERTGSGPNGWGQAGAETVGGEPPGSQEPGTASTTCWRASASGCHTRRRGRCGSATTLLSSPRLAPHLAPPGTRGLRTAGGPFVLLTTDTVVAGIDADLSLTSLADLGWKAMAVNLSDIAAMGGSPATPSSASSVPARTSSVRSTTGSWRRPRPTGARSSEAT